MPYIGKYESFAGSHHLNHLLTEEILRDKEHFKVVEASEMAQRELAKVFA
jgi:UDP-3-O-[3-hydroxymyristoyl] N-acetylglucosamine deacetylase